MSDELQLVTTNAASDGWVDGVPGAVSTGYQAQNTVLQALFNGLDKSSVRIDGAFLKIDPSGVIDDSGLPFVVSTLITLSLPTTGAANWFLRVVPGSTALERSIEFTDDRGTYDASKNGFYNTGGERVLNWVYSRHSGILERITEDSSSDYGTLSYIDTRQGDDFTLTSTPQKLPFGPLYYDSKFQFDESNNKINIFDAGLYSIFFQVTTNVGPGGAGDYTLTIYLYKNGVELTNTTNTAFLTGAASASLSTAINLAPGDYLEVFAKSTITITGRIVSMSLRSGR